MKIDQQLIREIAELAALDPESLDVEKLAGELARISDYIAVLDELPDASVDIEARGAAPRRADQIRKADIRDKVFQNAPQIIDEHFAVSPVPSASQAKGADDEKVQ